VTNSKDALVLKLIELEQELAEARAHDYRVIWQTFLKEASLLKDDLIKAERFLYKQTHSLMGLVNKWRNDAGYLIPSRETTFTQ
jgi:hypothetical protein